MIWFLATIVLIVAAMTQQSAPVRALIISALLGVLVAGIYFRLQTPPVASLPRAPTTAPRDVATIPLEAIQASRLEMTGTGAPWNLTGTVANQSSRDLLSFTIAVTRFDCYTGALDASGCVTLWDGEQLVSLYVPAHATRNFAVAIWPHNSVAPRGRTRDSFEIKSVRGR